MIKMSFSSWAYNDKKKSAKLYRKLSTKVNMFCLKSLTFIFHRIGQLVKADSQISISSKFALL